MNNEKMNQIIDEVYRKYSMSCIKETKKQEREMKEKGGWNTLCLEPYFEDKEKFIRLIKTNPEFSEKWGLKIEERELSLEERSFVAQSNHYEVSQNIKMFTGIDEDDALHNNLDEHNIPTKLITITYNNETIEVYE